MTDDTPGKRGGLGGLLASTPVIWLTFIAMVLMTIGFAVIMQVWDFTVIDEMYNAEDIRTHIAQMTPLQRTVHVWTTAVLDVAYPFAYAGFFIGVALRFFGKAGPWLAIPSMLVIPTDLFEGFAQVNLLLGNMEYLPVKPWVTPLKLVLFLAGLVVTFAGLGLGLFRKVRG